MRRINWNPRGHRSVRFEINETSDPSRKEAMSQERSQDAPFWLWALHRAVWLTLR